jgi:hypothetical protein
VGTAPAEPLLFYPAFAQTCEAVELRMSEFQHGDVERVLQPLGRQVPVAPFRPGLDVVGALEAPPRSK